MQWRLNEFLSVANHLEIYLSDERWRLPSRRRRLGGKLVGLGDSKSFAWFVAISLDVYSEELCQRVIDFFTNGLLIISKVESSLKVLEH